MHIDNVIISNMYEMGTTESGYTYMVDKVGDELSVTDIPTIRNVLKTIAHSSYAQQKAKHTRTLQDCTPYTVKKPENIRTHPQIRIWTRRCF